MPAPTRTTSSFLERLIFASTIGCNEKVIKKTEISLAVFLNMDKTFRFYGQMNHSDGF
jgi:hypothetical protein